MSIDYKTSSKLIRRIKQDDPDYILHDEWAQYPRAAIELTQNCPDYIASAVREGFRKNYIKLTAAVYDHELMWEKLSK